MSEGLQATSANKVRIPVIIAFPWLSLVIVFFLLIYAKSKRFHLSDKATLGSDTFLRMVLDDKPPKADDLLKGESDANDAFF